MMNAHGKFGGGLCSIAAVDYSKKPYDLLWSRKMSSEEFVCLGKLREHSFYTWFWSRTHNAYYRECSLYGCPFSETAKELVPQGETIFIDHQESCTHNWSTWRDTATQDGLYIPPWLYSRECSVCKTKQMAEQLVKEIEQPP